MAVALRMQRPSDKILILECDVRSSGYFLDCIDSAVAELFEASEKRKRDCLGMPENDERR